MPKFWTKKALFWYFGARILKSCCYIFNEHPQICQIVKFCEIMKMLKFGTKNVLLGIFGLEFENIIVIFEIGTLEVV